MKRIVKRSGWGLLLSGAGLLALRPSPAQEASHLVQDKPGEQTTMQQLATANNTFGLRAFQKLCVADKGKNVFVSPTSLAQALQMTLNGADGTTKAGMEKTLALEEMSLAQVNQGSQELSKELLAADPKVTISIANSLWLRANAGIREDFVQRVQQAYGAEVGELSGTPAPINAWVSQHTNDKIKQIVTVNDVAGADAVLVNAVYFKGLWSRPFEKSLTKADTFTTEAGAKTPVKLMAQKGKFAYRIYEDGLQVAQLPYGSGRYSLLVALPAKDQTVSELVARMTPNTVTEWVRSLGQREGTVKLPRFQSEYEADMRPPLTELGMALAFNPEANFSLMARKGLYIWAVKHKTFLDVNEEGTEAAAATAVIMGRSAIAIDRNPPFEMIMNRPFVCAIRDTTTGAVVFLGAIHAPQSK